MRRLFMDPVFRRWGKCLAYSSTLSVACSFCPKSSRTLREEGYVAPNTYAYDDFSVVLGDTNYMLLSNLIEDAGPNILLTPIAIVMPTIMCALSTFWICLNHFGNDGGDGDSGSKF